MMLSCESLMNLVNFKIRSLHDLSNCNSITVCSITVICIMEPPLWSFRRHRHHASTMPWQRARCPHLGGRWANMVSKCLSLEGWVTKASQRCMNMQNNICEGKTTSHDQYGNRQQNPFSGLLVPVITKVFADQNVLRRWVLQALLPMHDGVSTKLNSPAEWWTYKLKTNTFDETKLGTWQDFSAQDFGDNLIRDGVPL